MQTVNIRNAKTIVKEAVKVGAEVFLMGTPGIGKTQALKQAAEELEIGCRVEEGTSLDPMDVRGILVPNLTTQEAFYTRPAIFPHADKDGEKGLLIIDEIGGCMPATQKALQSLICERRVGEHELPKGWLPVGTGNYATDDAGAFPLLTSLKDRAVLINVEPDFETWKEDFAIPQGIDRDIISFLNFKPDCFYTFEKRARNEKGKEFASPRTWEKASPFLSSGLTNGNLLAVLAGCLGDGPATELTAFRKVHDKLPNVTSIYRGTSDVVPKDSEPSVMYALSGALVGFLDRLPEDLSVSMAVERLLEYTQKLPGEFSILTIKEAIVKPEIKAEIVKSKGWIPWVDKYGEAVFV